MINAPPPPLSPAFVSRSPRWWSPTAARPSPAPRAREPAAARRAHTSAGRSCEARTRGRSGADGTQSDRDDGDRRDAVNRRALGNQIASRATASDATASYAAASHAMVSQARASHAEIEAHLQLCGKEESDTEAELSAELTRLQSGCLSGAGARPARRRRPTAARRARATACTAPAPTRSPRAARTSRQVATRGAHREVQGDPQPRRDHAKRPSDAPGQVFVCARACVRVSPAREFVTP
eukprot:6172460-Pleurochrysis_carterae.AAC.3